MASYEKDKKWFRQFRSTPAYKRLKRRPIAYFCTEYGLVDRSPLYAGGLGILAGDVMKEADDQELPLIGIGLYYHHGYICGTRDVAGRAVEVCSSIHPQSAGFYLVKDKLGKRLTIKVPVGDHDVSAQAWEWRDRGITLYVLDTNIEENTEADRRITDRLYVSDKEMRLKQELLLGIGGLRLIEALKIHPSLYHLNEGHSAFLAIELIRHEMEERGLDFDEAKQFARRRIVLTNHTLVAAGNEVFSNDLVAVMLSKYANDLSVPVHDIVKLGLVQESSLFSMTMLALRMAGVINAVSELHSDKAREIWRDHPMVSVTNGVHLPTWDVVGDTYRAGSFWKKHQERKRELLEYVRLKTKRDWKEDALLLGWARRVVKYKRPLSLIEDVQGFAKIARDAKQPVRVLFSGHPHPSDEAGQQLLAELRKIVDHDLQDVAVYLPDYGMETAKMMVSGCDVWLNTPVVGFEACGTSGMKAALNGVLPCSTNDGWIHEADLFKVGWLLDSGNITESLLGVLQNDIAPMYYDRNQDGVPAVWEEHMRNARDMVTNQFSATRMLAKYIQLMYL